jgi:hypothetical protein
LSGVLFGACHDGDDDFAGVSYDPTNDTISNGDIIVFPK